MARMNEHNKTQSGPNGPCACGSGLKYKKCCALKGEAAKGSSRFLLRGLVLAGGLIFAVALVYGNVAPAPQARPSLPRIPAGTGGTGGSTPAAWHYDVANDRHWHPGHSHWHDGPPPPASQREGAPSGQRNHTVAGTDLPGGVTPEPWHYDAAQDRHWHPEHAHWHSGPPPENR